MASGYLIIIVLLCLGLGFVAGLLVSHLTHRPDNRPVPRTPPSVNPAAGEPAHSPASIPAPSPAFQPVMPVTPPAASIPLVDPENPQEPAVTLSIIEQIDNILQEELKKSPLKGSHIRLQEVPDGVRVFVGLQVYDSVEAVADVEARNMIKRAVQAWEKKQ